MQYIDSLINKIAMYDKFEIELIIIVFRMVLKLLMQNVLYCLIKYFNLKIPSTRIFRNPRFNLSDLLNTCI